MRDSGRNCSFFPIARGRFDSLLKIREDSSGLTFFFPSAVHVGNVFWGVFFSYVLLFMIAFAVLMLGVNNSGWDLTPLFQHEQREIIFIAGAAVLLLPFIILPVIASFKPYPAMNFNPSDRTITAGYKRGLDWKKVAHSYSFSDLDTIEVLRNYEFRTEGYIGRTGGNDAYELNLYFGKDDKWIGISESSRRQKILGQAEHLSTMTGVDFVENNLSDQYDSATASSASRSFDRPMDESSYTSPSARSVKSGSGGTGGPDEQTAPLPPFLMDQMGEPVHSVEVVGSKLKRKGNPFRMKMTDKFGQGFQNHMMPLVSHLVNKESYERSYAALKFLCTDRDDNSDRMERVAALKAGGWKSEDELLALMAIVYDARSGPVPGLNADRDSFERYYMTLKDQLRVPSVKFRVIFFEYMDKLIEQYPERIDFYEQNPGTLQQVQNSENYALRFILDVAAVVIIVLFYFIFGAIFSLFGSVVGRILTVAAVAGMIYLWRRLRKKLG